MAEYKVQSESLTAIADAIREKAGTSDALTLAGMAEAIAAIEAGGGVVCNSGVYTPAEDVVLGQFAAPAYSVAIEHGLGALPFAFVFIEIETYNAANYFIGYSFMQHPSLDSCVYHYAAQRKDGSGDTATFCKNFDNATTLRNNEVAYVVGAKSNGKLRGGKKYMWVAVAVK